MFEKSWIRITLCAVAFITGVPLFLYLFQDRLLFNAQSLSDDAVERIKRDSEIRNVSLRTSDGTTLKGWYRSGDEQFNSVLIYFGGNAEEASWILEHANDFKPWSLVVFNYRGYGNSKGKPSQEALFADALDINDYVVKEFKPKRIAVLGRSLGTGVATYLCANRKLTGAILISPYDSMTAVAQDIYPYIPVRFLLKYPFDAALYARNTATPMLTLVGDNDQLVRIPRSQALFRAWRGEKRWLMLPGQNHNSVVDDPNLWLSIQRFLQTLSRM